MKKKHFTLGVVLVLSLALLGLAGCTYLVGRQAEAGSSVDFEEIDPYAEGLDEEIQEWYEESMQEEGIHRLNKGGHTFILVSAGEKPTGGYELTITSVTAGEDVLKVGANLTSPPADAMVITVITYPSALIRIPEDARELDLVLEQ